MDMHAKTQAARISSLVIFEYRNKQLTCLGVKNHTFNSL